MIDKPEYIILGNKNRNRSKSPNFHQIQNQLSRSFSINGLVNSKHPQLSSQQGHSKYQSVAESLYVSPSRNSPVHRQSFNSHVYQYPQQINYKKSPQRYQNNIGNTYNNSGYLHPKKYTEVVIKSRPSSKSSNRIVSSKNIQLKPVKNPFQQISQLKENIAKNQPAKYQSPRMCLTPLVINRNQQLQIIPNNIKQVQIHHQLSIHQQNLVRKVKVLETRISQLHKDKQICVLKLHQEIRKLTEQNFYLRSKYQKQILQKTSTNSILHQKSDNYASPIHSLQSQKNLFDKNQSTRRQSMLKQKVKVLEQQLQYYKKKYQKNQQQNKKNQKIYQQNKNKQKSQISDYQISQINAYPFQDKIKQIMQSLQISTQQNQKLQNNITLLQNQIKQKHNYIDHIQLEKQQLKKQLNSLQISVLENSKNIQQNNKMIILQYQKQIVKLTQQIQQLQNTNANQQHEIIDNNQAQQQLNSIMDKIAHLSQKNQQLQLRVEQLTKQNTKLEENQINLKFQLSHKQINLTNLQKQIKLKNQQYYNSLKKLQNYQIEIQDLKTICQKYTINKKSIIKSQSWVQTDNFQLSNQNCKKCTQLMKSVIKLNLHIHNKTKSKQ